MSTVVASVPPLESGDHLTRVEFHRRYCAHPEIKKAELIEGVVYEASPTRVSVHGVQHARVMTWLGAYSARHPELLLADNATVFLDADNEPQPDALLCRLEGGDPRLTEKGYLEGAPQLVVEVAASSASYDLHEKLRAYRRNGVQEYIVWRVLDGAIDWFRPHEGAYRRVEPDTEGFIESMVFPGLRLQVERMLAGT